MQQCRMARRPHQVNDERAERKRFRVVATLAAAFRAECRSPMKGALSPTAGPTVGMRDKRHWVSRSLLRREGTGGADERGRTPRWCCGQVLRRPLGSGFL